MARAHAVHVQVTGSVVVGLIMTCFSFVNNYKFYVDDNEIFEQRATHNPDIYYDYFIILRGT